MGVGTAVITVTTVDGGHTATCSVTVTEAEVPAVPATGVTLDKSEVTLEEGGSDTLTANVSPEDASNKNVSWSSSNPAVATVENGLVKAVGVGTAVITVTTVDGGHTATCKVTVTENPEIPETGDNLPLIECLILVGMSGAVLYWANRKKLKKQ